MKIVQINTTCGVGSTGKICVSICQLLAEQNCENYILYSYKTSGHPLGISCSSGRYIRTQAIKSRLLGNYGFNSRQATKTMIAQLGEFRPDIVHLHNIHGHDCNLEMLFGYFKEHKTKLIWTFHDCWTFTGYCPYFDLAKCDRWKSSCEKCPQYRRHGLIFDRSKLLYRRKKELFSGLDLTIVTPSQWLADLVKQSFLKDYPVKVINNGIDLDLFRPTPSDFRQKYRVPNDKYIVLGVAFGWDRRKGLDVFVDLAKRFGEKYQIVLVGTDDKVDRQLPASIISIHRTQNQRELAEIYTAADVFANPTREDNYPTVNMEAIACGTPVLTFRTGGSPEILDETCGAVVDCDDVDAMAREIIRICEEKPYTREACLERAKCFDKNERYEEYIALYERIVAKRDQNNRA